MARTNANEPPAQTSDAITVSAADLADGQAALGRTFGAATVGETVVLDGAGLALSVNRGELVATDGLADHRRQRRISRAQAAGGRLRRVLIIGDGMVTTEAMVWCHGLGVTLVVSAPSGEPLLVGGPRLYRDGNLTRAQAIAPINGTGIQVVRWLLDRRLADQARVASRLMHREDRAQAIHDLRTPLTLATTPADAMVIEMQAAAHYWAAWQDELRLTFAAKDRPRVPAHWSRFGGRSSPLGETATNRHASSPTNAMINFGMRLAEIETTLACHALGLDPCLGLAHADRPHRPAFVLDLMEPIRCTVEHTVWHLSQTRTFRKTDFAENASGEVRLLAPFVHQLATALMPVLRDAIAPIAERVAQTLAAGVDDVARVPTPLTRSRHKSGRAARGDQSQDRRPTPEAATRLWTCPDCGRQVDDPQRVRCEDCIHADSSQTPEIRGRRGRAIAARQRANRLWADAQKGSGYDLGDWDRIAANLQGVKLADIMAATGLSKSFASTVRAGKSKPHIAHWAALASLGHRADSRS